MTQNGIHHVTAISGPVQRNLDFHSRVLGQRLVKKTVNFDDPATYHLYYGDTAGSPGSILTFFPWEHAAPGRQGIGETQETVFRVPQSAIGFWMQRLLAAGAHPEREERFGQTVLRFRDPDGMRLALAGIPGLESEPAWTTKEITAEHALRGLQGVSLMLEDAAPTGAILEDIFGYRRIGEEKGLIRFATDANAMGGVVDLRAVGGFLPARQGAGSVHHIAFRAADDAAEAAMVRRLAENHQIRTTEQKDRNYFRSVYFREPGHVLFEIATDVPGFAVDEPAATLGEALKLPAFLEGHRGEIERMLPALAA